LDEAIMWVVCLVSFVDDRFDQCYELADSHY
jgi:hypothetical protein